MEIKDRPTLFLFPSSLGEENLSDVLPCSYNEFIEPIRLFFVEELRTARRFLRKAGFTSPFEDVCFIPVNEHNTDTSVEDLLKEYNINPNELPSKMGLLSEAGLPCVADPGSNIVAWAHKQGIRVKPISGPSSLFMSLMASGLNGQCFAFNGYLPSDPSSRNKKIKELEAISSRSNQTQLFIETPYRNSHLWESLVQQCRPDTMLCVAKNISMEKEDIKTLSIAQWKKHGPPSFNKENAVFLILSRF